MQVAIKEIQKHNDKINKILNKISDQYPSVAEEIELALYSSLKIQKLTKKLHSVPHITQQHIKNKNNGVKVDIQQDEDQFHANAMSIFEGFKMSTYKLEKKIGMLLMEQQAQKQQRIQKIKSKNQKYSSHPLDLGNHKNFTRSKRQLEPSQYQYPDYTPNSAFNSHSRYKQSNSNSRSKKSSKRKITSNDMYKQPSFRGFDQQNESKNLSEIDQQIMMLTSALQERMKQNKQQDLQY